MRVTRSLVLYWEPSTRACPPSFPLVLVHVKCSLCYHCPPTPCLMEKITSQAEISRSRTIMDPLLGKVSRFSIKYDLMPGWSMLAGFKILTKAAVPSAFYDYHDHEFDVPWCHENTQVSVLEKVGDWVNLVIDITAFIMWLYGAAGAGKSAITRTMAEILHSRQQLLATFFFSCQDSSRNHIKSFIATLAYNIALSVPESRPLIVATIENDPHIRKNVECK